jgi:hypothetical protein
MTVFLYRTRSSALASQVAQIQSADGDLTVFSHKDLSVSCDAHFGNTSAVGEENDAAFCQEIKHFFLQSNR